MEENILNISTREFLQQKLSYHEREASLLKEIMSKYLMNDKEGNISKADKNSLSLEKKEFAYPSTKKMLNNIMEYLKNNRVAIRTSEIINFYHNGDLEKDPLVKENLIKRYSGKLNELVKQGELYKKPIENERGNWYTYYEELLAEKE